MKSSTAASLFKAYFRDSALKDLFRTRVSLKRSVGADGVRIDRFESTLDQEVEIITRKVASESYQFTSYRQVLVLKGAGRPPRVISVPTIRDRLVLRATCDVLARVFEDCHIEKPHYYVRSLKEYSGESPSDLSFVRVDVKDFYPSIKRDILMRFLRRRIRTRPLLKLIEGALLTPTGGEEARGVPQGLSISNILSSIYMKDFDDKTRERWTYWRYVDDIVMVCPPEQARSAFDYVEKELGVLGLSVHTLGSAGKSVITPAEEGVEYLGYNIRPGMASVQKKAIAKLISSIISIFTDYRYHKNLQRLLWRLNLRITGCRFEGTNYGWMFYFIQTDDIKQLFRLDCFISNQLEKVGLEHLRPRIMRFVKVYYEIRYGFINMKLVPDFDKFGLNEKRNYLVAVAGLSISRVPDSNIERIFFKTISRAVNDLERDLIPAS